MAFDWSGLIKGWPLVGVAWRVALIRGVAFDWSGLMEGWPF